MDTGGETTQPGSYYMTSRVPPLLPRTTPGSIPRFLHFQF